ncbi:MAG: hypothetical protein V1678_02920 [Candidatus Aenigmatarchaeota archaeon]
MAQILATITGFMFLMWSVSYSTAINSLTESNTALRHSTDTTLNFPQYVLTLYNLKTAVNDTNVTMNYITNLAEMYSNYSSYELSIANSYNQLATSSIIVSNNALMFSAYFLGITMLFAIIGFIQDRKKDKRN